MLEKIQLGDYITIYKIKYDWEHSQEKLLERVEQNYIINEGITDDNTSLIKFQCREFNSIYIQSLNVIKKLFNISDDWDGTHLHTNWIYRQNKNSTIQNYHLHSYTHTKAKILNDWSYCFYLSIPNTVSNNEGCIMFMDKENNEYSIRPHEGEIIFFTSDTHHTPTLTPKTENYRISICGNISFNVPKIKTEKSIL